MRWGVGGGERRLAGAGGGGFPWGELVGLGGESKGFSRGLHVGRVV